MGQIAISKPDPTLPPTGQEFDLEMGQLIDDYPPVILYKCSFCGSSYFMQTYSGVVILEMLANLISRPIILYIM